ncbi:MAG: non-canonical purine NTP pyrophosphatase, RdgB/HAM1 family [Micrococcales bacterium]|nr:non-canonical purine NTP pyrophosphatase, RdgB/HAM1 family [Micrococcales bacterium]
MTTQVVLASRNPGKAEELRRILADCGLPVEVLGAEVFADLPDIPETGASFAENSKIKAEAVARHTGLIAIADDSGLAVDALNGMPGILSARWAGKAASDQRNLDLVLEQVADVSDDRRGAAFCCAASAARIGPADNASFLVSEAEIRGRLLRERRGDHGFGYDPIFLPDGYDLTTAQMSSEAKDRISHRGQALSALAIELESWLV